MPRASHVDKKDLARIEAIKNMDIVFLAARWTKYIEGTGLSVEAHSETILYTPAQGESSNADVTKNPFVVQASLKALRDRILTGKRRLVLLGTVPEIPWNVGERLKSWIIFNTPLPAPAEISEVQKRQARSDAILSEIAKRQDVFFIPLAAEICTPECPTHADGTAFYRDNNHLTEEGALRLVLPILQKALPEIANAPDTL